MVTTFFDVQRGDAISAKTSDGGTASTIYALNDKPNGKGAAIKAQVNGTGPGVWAVSEKGEGVHAETHNGNQLAALTALTTKGSGAAIYATAENNGIGIHVKAANREALVAETNSESIDGNAAIAAYNNNSAGKGPAIFARSNGNGNGIDVVSPKGVGIYTASKYNTGLAAQTETAKYPAISAINLNKTYRNSTILDNGSALYALNRGTAPTIHAISEQGKIAGYFEGNVEITKKLTAKELIVGTKDLMDIIDNYEKRIAALEKMYKDHKSGIDALPR
jgi:hypothetical protein